MLRKLLGAVLMTTALGSGGALAKDTIVWWDFLGGGDGVRMKSMIDEFNKEHAGKVEIEATTLDWGVPFYSKVQTSAAVGQGPDMMTYHESRMPLGVSTGSLSPIDATKNSRPPASRRAISVPANWKAAQGPDGKQYAVPLDIHSIILYYNKPLLQKAGLLGDDGKPKGPRRRCEFRGGAGQADRPTDTIGLSTPTADGASMWRIFYTLLNQEDGEIPRGRQIPRRRQSRQGDHRSPKCRSGSRAAGRRARRNIRPRSLCSPRARRRCTSTASGKCRPWLTSQSQGPVVRLGRDSDPDHSSRIPPPGPIRIPSRSPTARAIRSTPPSASSCSTTIHWFNRALDRMGQRRPYPGYLPVQDSAEFKAMKPNSEYTRASPRPRCSIRSLRSRASPRRSMTRPATTSCRP